MPDRAALITALILERPMCEECIATKSGLSTSVIDSTLATAATVLELHRQTDRCRVCGETKRVVSIEQPSV